MRKTNLFLLLKSLRILDEH